ncbi:MAG TPA: HlyD family efflux transporter periplasmic adaptor subunit [Kofleriaceae bacterium]|nr:HlyD family efflux transporter periplasmic adaptor subunit [Kofleriaceae bacterium]
MNSTRALSSSPGFVGVLAPRRSDDIVAPFTSTIVGLTVNLGDRVAAGQVLGRLDDRPLREEHVIAQAALRASLAEAAQAEVARRAAANVLDRERRAFQNQIVAEAQVAAADFEERKAVIAVTRSLAAVDEQRARIAKLEAKLRDTTLVATLAGSIALQYRRDGERVVEGQPIMRVISSGDLFVRFAIPADKAGTLASGDDVDVLFEAQQLRSRAIVRRVAPELDPVAQMILAEAELVQPPARLQAGMVCRIMR